MKSRFIVFILFLIAFNFAKSEDESLNYLQADVSKFISELKKKDVDTICIYESYLSGGESIEYNYNDSISEDENKSKFILWKKYNKTNLTKINPRFEYTVIEIHNKEILDFFFENIKTIKNEKVKMFEYIVKVKNKKLKYFTYLNNSSHKFFSFMLNNDTVTKDFDLFDLIKTDSSGSKIKTNMNYDYNMNLKSKLLLDKLDSLISKIDSENLLTKKRK